MKLWINGSFLLSRVTGGERYSVEVSRRLAREYGWKIAVAPHFDRTHLADCSDRMVEVAPAPLGLGWTNVALPWALPRDALLFSPLILGPLLVRRQMLSVFDVSCLDHPEWFSAEFARTYRWRLPWLGRLVPRILTISEYSKQRILTRLGVPESKVVVIPCGVSTDFNPGPSPRREELRRKFSLPRRFLLSVGSLDPRKNLDRLVQAWQSLPAADRSRCPLVLAGGSAVSFAPTKLGSLIADDETIRHLGYVDQNDLPALYAEAEAFVFPSLYEGFGLPVLEAMACGTPVFCSDTTSLPEVGGPAAVYFDPGSEVELAAVLRDILAGRFEAQNMREQGYRQAARFSWDATAAAVHREALRLL